MFILLIITHVVLYYTRWGLRTRAVGENPHAADTLGINVQRMRWINVIIGGMIAGLAGAGLLFGFSDVLGFTFQALEVPVPPQFVQMVPYLVTIIVLAGLVGRAVGPKAAGVPYDKEGK
jgi:general nucleoside transport system permease protein